MVTGERKPPTAVLTKNEIALLGIISGNRMTGPEDINPDYAHVWNALHKKGMLQQMWGASDNGLIALGYKWNPTTMAWENDDA